MQTFGALLRQLRVERGFSTRRLADRAGLARSTIRRFELGQRRPRPSTLGYLAVGLDPDRRAEILARLVAAAGDEIAPRNQAWERYQIRKRDEALRAGRIPLPLAWERRIRLTAAAQSMRWAASLLNDRAAELLDRPGTGRMIAELMSLSDQLDDEADRLQADVGNPVDGTPPRRWRGDAPDVAPFAPPLSDLRAVRRWVWEWQVREGHLRPRSARERAIAATGQRERQAIRDAPEPSPAKRAKDIATRAEGDDGIPHLRQ